MGFLFPLNFWKVYGQWVETKACVAVEDVNLMSWTRLLANFPPGLFLGAAAAFLVSWLIDEGVTSALVLQTTYVFQALLGMIAAAIALAGTLKNINNQQEMAERARLSDLKAAKAVLPLALTKMVHVGRSGVDFVLSYARFWVTRPDQAALVLAGSQSATPLVNLTPSMTRGT